MLIGKFTPSFRRTVANHKCSVVWWSLRITRKVEFDEKCNLSNLFFFFFFWLDEVLNEKWVNIFKAEG